MSALRASWKRLCDSVRPSWFIKYREPAQGLKFSIAPSVPKKGVYFHDRWQYWEPVFWASVTSSIIVAWQCYYTLRACDGAWWGEGGDSFEINEAERRIAEMDADPEWDSINEPMGRVYYLEKPQHVVDAEKEEMSEIMRKVMEEYDREHGLK